MTRASFQGGCQSGLDCIIFGLLINEVDGGACVEFEVLSFRCDSTSALDDPFACLAACVFDLLVGFEAASNDGGNMTTSEYSVLRL